PVPFAIFVIGCRRCHRVFRIKEAGAARASDRADEGTLTPRRTPDPVSIGRRAEPAAGGSRQAPGRPTGNRLMGMLRQLRSTAIARFALAVAAGAVYVRLAILDSTHAAGRRALPMGRRMTAGYAAGESVCQRAVRPERLGALSREVRISATKNEGILTAMLNKWFKSPQTLEAL